MSDEARVEVAAWRGERTSEQGHRSQGGQGGIEADPVQLQELLQSAA